MLGPDPRGCAIHPVVLAVGCIVGSGLWMFSFKIMASACRIAAATFGAGQ